ncbi:MAG: hypothetical protein R3F56_25280 [Planctomycetota bacterium]
MPVSSSLTLPAASLLLLVAAGTAQSPTLVRDIYPGLASPNPGSDPRHGAQFGSVAVFTAERGSRWLWRTDGTAAGTTFIATGEAEVLGPLVNAGGTLFFVASDRENGAELWAFDLRGAVLVKDIALGSADSGVRSMVAVGSRLFFTADDGVHGRELWVSDGTSAGTMLVRDIHPSSADPAALTAVNGALYFTADDGIAGRELWRSDGTAAGTWRVADILPGVAGSNPQDLSALGSLVVFSADEGAQRELWRSDGTAAGTSRVVDLDGAGSGNPVQLVASGGHVWFLATTQQFGTELWRSDATAAGTHLVDDGLPGPASTPIENLAAFRGGVLFAGWRAATGHELYFSDGTNTQLIADLEPGSFGSLPSGFFVVGTNAYFTYLSPTTQWQVARTAGVPGDVVNLMPPNSSGWNPTILAAVGSGVLFTTDQDIGVGREPWITDGTAQQAHVLADLNTTPRSSGPHGFVELDGRLLFFANDGAHGSELWRSDGTTAGTNLAADLVPGPISSVPGGADRRGHVVHFTARGPENAPPFRLWQTDGTAAGTRALGALPNAVFGANVIATEAGLFMPVIGLQTIELMFSDGASAPQSLASGFTGLGGSIAFGGTFWFVVDDGVHGWELWHSDGTTAGTSIFVDLAPGAASAVVTSLTVAGDRLFFVADDGTHGFELWSTDGTSAGTRMHEIVPGPTNASPDGLAAVGGQVYFAAADASGDRELWRADGTPGGTVRVADIDPIGSSYPTGMVAAGDRVFFSAATAALGRELWVSDGTTGGTHLVADVRPGPGSGLAAGRVIAPLGSGARVLFAGDDGRHGVEPWMSDGTQAGTRMFADVNPGVASSAPAGFVTAGTHVFFQAASFGEGAELHAIDLTLVDAPLAVAYGAGCAGSNGVPGLGAQGLPALGTDFAWEVVRGRANAFAGLMLSSQRLYVPLPGGCELLVATDGLTLPLLTDAGGATALALRVPLDPVLLGVQLFAQAWVADSQGAFAGTLSTSNGLHVSIGR